MAYNEFRTPPPPTQAPSTTTSTIPDPETGSPLYETKNRSLLITILKQNDATLLNHYIEAHGPAATLTRGIARGLGPYGAAAVHGSTDCLDILLSLHHQQSTADPTTSRPAIPHGTLLTTTACRHAQLQTTEYLLDHHPSLGAIHDAEPGGTTPLLAAAACLSELSHHDSPTPSIPFTHPAWFRTRLTHAEALIRFLIARGASVHEIIKFSSLENGCCSDEQALEQRFQDTPPIETVLGRCMSRGSPELVAHLLANGADVHARQHHDNHSYWGTGFYGGRNGHMYVRKVTALHLGSFSWNAGGVRAVLEHGGGGSREKVVEMVNAKDDMGRIPLHYAAAGPGAYGEYISLAVSGEELVGRVVETMRVLLEADPGTVNARDEMGATAVHYVIEGQRRCGEAHLEEVVRFLVENGADLGARDGRGHSVLHRMAGSMGGSYGVVVGEGLLELLIDGVRDGDGLEQGDEDGNTALHAMAGSPRQVGAVRVLLARGADVRAVNSDGDTPLHKAMGGWLWARETRESFLAGCGIGDAFEKVTVDDRIRVKEEMVRVLLDGGAGELMDQPNNAGITPRQLQEMYLARWRRMDERERQRPAGRGRGRGIVMG
ncbi:ankyrin [Aspergillus ellipticus CBS 707.79]|uniref:Ankyrin n=1 Tax=Aspergillus ellipticus CBS 707.79 TaxID=1448320 RepID=A0A319D662_9EURO|nr:ankyrin [Aspergillus ellipticus CBS 707.79]